MTPAEVARLSRTVAHLRPTQAVYRVRLRVQQGRAAPVSEPAGRILARPEPVGRGRLAGLRSRPLDAHTPSSLALRVSSAGPRSSPCSA